MQPTAQTSTLRRSASAISEPSDRTSAPETLSTSGLVYVASCCSGAEKGTEPSGPIVGRVVSAGCSAYRANITFVIDPSLEGVTKMQFGDSDP